MPQLRAAVHGWLWSTVVDFGSPCDPPQPCGLRLTIPVFRSTMSPVAQIAPVTGAVLPRAARLPHPLDRALRD
jgi:hypothetical protein